MTADEAKQALKEGKRVRGKTWFKNNHIVYDIKNNVLIEVVDGKIFDIRAEDIFEDYKDDDWEIVE